MHLLSGFNGNRACSSPRIFDGRAQDEHRNTTCETGAGANSPTDPRHEPRQPTLGCPRIHGELLKLGIDVGQTSVAKYMTRHRRPPSQGWKTFLRNHPDGIASIDLFVVPTISFRLLYGWLILRHGRRHMLWLGVTAHPTAEWIARQLTEACGWEPAPRCIVRDRDRVYGEVFTRRLRARSSRPTVANEPTIFFCVLTSTFPAAPPTAEALLYTGACGIILSHPILGGLHHHYVRV
jgi:hypothetical protein